MRSSSMSRTAGLAVGLMALGAAVPASAEEITLNVLYPWPNLAPIHEQLAKDFTAENPDIKINFLLSPKDYIEGNAAIVRASLTNNLPDVYFAGYSVMQPMIDALAARNQLVPLTPFIAAEGADWLNANYNPNLMSLGASGGVQYAIPFNASTPIVYFNADLVKQAGHDPAAFPTSWDGLIKLAQDIDALGDDVEGMNVSIGSTGDDWTWQSMVLSMGGKIVNDAGTGVGFDDETGLKALTLARRIVEDTHMKVWTTRDPYRQQFFAGKLGFFITSPSAVSEFTNTVGGRFAMMTAPYPDVAANGGLPTGGNAVAITAQDPAHQQAAWRYVKFLTGPKAQAYVAQQTGYLPTNLLAADELKDFYAQNPNYATAFKQVGLSRPWPSYPGANSQEVWKAQRDIFTDVQNGVLTPADGLKKLVDTTNGLMK